MGSEIIKRKVSEVSPARLSNDRVMREGIMEGRKYANVRDICAMCGLNFLTEVGRIRQSSFASGRFSEVTAPHEMWIDFDAIGHWLDMAPVEPGSRDFDSASKIKEYCSPALTVYPAIDLQDANTLTMLSSVLAQAADEINRKNAEISRINLENAALTVKANALDLIADAEDGAICVSDAAKILKVKIDVLNLYLEEKVKWAFRRKYGKRKGPLVISEIARNKGYVVYHYHPRQPSGHMPDPQMRITPKGMHKLSQDFSGPSPQSILAIR